MLELGQPMHAFDYDLLTGGHIIVRRAREGEKITSLDGAQRDLTTGMLCITDPSGPVAIAGVMGGLATEVTNKTVSILLESAFFNPVSIRKTSKALGLRSEASQRFEKGIDIGGCARAANRAAQLIIEMGAGEAVAGMVDNIPAPLSDRVIQFRPSRASSVLGADISKNEAAGILASLRFTVQDAGETLLVTVPSHRVDVSQEVDLIEEVARIHGYNQIPDTLPYGQSTRGLKTKEQSLTDQVRDLLAGSGLYEVMTYSFINNRVYDLMNLAPDSSLRNALKIQNPLSEERSVMRTMLAPCLLEILAKNYSRRVQNGAIFELGRVFIPTGENRQPEERTILAAAAMGRSPASWNQAAGEYDYYYLKGVLENLFSRIGAVPVNFLPETNDPSYHPGKTAFLEADGIRLGVVGELHPDVLENYDLPEKVVAFELDLGQLIAVSGNPAGYSQLPRFPGIERDIAILVRKNVPAADILSAIQEAGGKLLRAVALFDVYQGEQVPEGMRSMAFALKFQAEDRTLTDAEAVEITGEIAGALAAKFGAELRS
jgi:phenylalanyl-tRNA synthetase beta chain